MTEYRLVQVQTENIPGLRRGNGHKVPPQNKKVFSIHTPNQEAIFN